MFRAVQRGGAGKGRGGRASVSCAKKHTRAKWKLHGTFSPVCPHAILLTNTHHSLTHANSKFLPLTLKNVTKKPKEHLLPPGSPLPTRPAFPLTIQTELLPVGTTTADLWPWTLCFHPLPQLAGWTQRHTISQSYYVPKSTLTQHCTCHSHTDLCLHCMWM